VHTYTVELERYDPQEGEVEVEADYQYTRVHELVPSVATIEVISQPSGAAIWLNNRRIRERTPTRVPLKPGDYTVAVHSDGYIMSEKLITLGPAETKRVELTMKPGNAPAGMVLVPAGKFIFGDDEAAPDERPQSEVELKAFYIDKYEVTNAQFKEVFPDHKFEDGDELLPVTGVSYDEAIEYARALDRRLPTEMEWEKAARGTDGREYPWGDAYDRGRAAVERSKNSDPDKVGSHLTGNSVYGCADMAGNAYEWTSDIYRAYEGNPDVTKEYGQSYRVLRGGSYLKSAYDARCARRHYDRPDAERVDYGFRCAKDVEE
jgi:formylglycine-generating enzyme required for sulfatase activity